jgi:hypothetical protein
MTKTEARRHLLKTARVEFDSEEVPVEAKPEQPDPVQGIAKEAIDEVALDISLKRKKRELIDIILKNQKEGNK